MDEGNWTSFGKKKKKEFRELGMFYLGKTQRPYIIVFK
jgi:hypothetical protein